MAHEVIIPRLGWSMDEGVFVEWLKREGEQVELGDLLYTLEGEKAIQEIEAIDAGILRIPADGPEEGQTVAVGTVIAWLCEADEPPPWEAEGTPAVATADSESRKPADETPAASPAARPGPQPANRSPQSAPDAKATPRARRLATELGIDWTTISATGKNRRVRERDVRAAAEAGLATTVPTPQVPGVSPMRKTIADRMLAASQSTAPVTLTTTADATNLVSLRRQFRDTAGDRPAPGYNELLLKLTAVTLRAHPLLRASWTDEGIVVGEQIDIALAVDTDEGLLAPVIRDPGSRTLAELAESLADLVDRACSRRLSVDEMTGGVFTITNLGAYGVETFTPILNAPQSAVLGVGCIARRPAVDGEEIIARDELSLSLTFDHRVLDGAPAARFLDDLRQAIENPGAMLVS